MGAQKGKALTPQTSRLRLYRTGVFVALAVLSLASLWLLRSLSFDFNPQRIYESNSKAFHVLQEHDRIYGRDDNVIIVLVDGGRMDQLQGLSYLRQLSEALQQVKGVMRVDGLPNARLFAEEDGALSALPVLPAGPIADEALARVRKTARDPLLGGVLVSHDLQAAALFAVLDPKLFDLQDLQPVVEGIEVVVAKHPPPQALKVHLTGIPFVRVDAVRDLIQDQSRFLPLTALIYGLLLLFMFRWLWGVLLPIAAVGLSILWAVAGIVLLGMHINIINNVLPTLLFVIGISDSIHLIARYREEISQGRDGQEAVSIAFKHLVLACFLTSVTTAVGMGSLIVSQNPLLRDFGFVAALGVMLAYVSTLSVIPAALSLVRPPKVIIKAPGAGDRVDQMLAAVALYIVKRPRRFLLGSLFLTALFGLLSTGLKVDSYLMAVYPDDHPNARTNALVEKFFGGAIPMDVELISKKGQDLRRDADLLQRVAKLQGYLEKQPGVGRTVSLVDLLAAIYRSISEDTDNAPGAQPAEDTGPAEDSGRALPLSAATVAQLMLVAELGGDEVEAQFASFVVPGGKRMRIRGRIADFGARKVNATVTRIKAEIDKIFYGRDDIELRITGDGVVGSSSIDRFIGDLSSSVFTAGLLIFITIGILFGSLRMGLISILPSTTPLLATLAMMSVAGIYLDITSIVVFAMALGLAVDHSIHILARYREERTLGAGAKAAVVRAYRGSGRAVFFAAGLLLIGFLVLLTSSFLPTRRTGFLSSVCVIGAVIGVLVMLPSILVLFDKGRRAASYYKKLRDKQKPA